MSDSGVDFLEADFGEQNAAGGAYHLNNTKPEYWDKWVQQGVRSPIWPFFFLLACSAGLAALPMVIEFVASVQQDQQQQQAQHAAAQPGSQSQPAIETQDALQLSDQSATTEPAAQQYQYQQSAPDQYQASWGAEQGQQQYGANQQLPQEPNSSYASGSYASTPGYDSRFGKPVR